MPGEYSTGRHSPPGHRGAPRGRSTKRDRIRRWKNLNTGVLSVEDCAQLWIDAGGKEKDAAMAAAITRPESGGQVDIVNPIGATGLWQIHPGGEQYKNAWNNAKAAVGKRRGSPNRWGPNPWEVCHDAKCSNLQAAADQIFIAGTQPGKGLDVNPVDNVADAIAAVLGPVGSFFKIITDADTWVRIGKVLLGAIILLLVINQITGAGSRLARRLKPV